MQTRHTISELALQDAQITVRSDFDSGNLHSAVLENQKLVLTPALDPMNPQYSSKHSSKTFFHFKVQTSSNTSVPVVIKNMKILQYFSNDEQFEQMYRICVGRKHSKSWSSLITYQKTKLKNMKRIQSESSFELHFQLTIKEGEQIYLAYHYPYPYQQSQQYLHQVKERVHNLNQHHSANIYFNNQLLIQSIEGRSVNLLTITQESHKSKEEEPRISKSLFPFFQLEGRSKKFHKPYIMFTCRVHSGQTSSSFALQGIMNFLLSQEEKSQLLLKYFTFIIVPVVNPDGVYHGTYRMDTLGHNLNRFYNTGQSHKQPSVFAIQTIVSSYSNRLAFFMDLHSHPHPNKGSFIYGNCHQQLEDQTESQLFAKLLYLQSECFSYNWSNFSNSQMNSRDLNQLLTKDGSARVQMFKLLNIPFVFTMEMGYHGCNIKNRNEPNHPFLGDYRRKQKIFSTEDYRQHGKSILTTIFKMFLLNSPSALKQEQSKLLQQYREDLCKELVQKQDRFRQMDGFIFKKVKTVNETIHQQFYEPFFKRYPFITLHQSKSQSKPLEMPISKTPPLLDEERYLVRRKVNNHRRQISLTLKNTPRTIDPLEQFREVPIKTFKSALQPREEQDISGLIESIKAKKSNYHFVKHLNLNFNPFPINERKRIYNTIGTQKTTLKKRNISQLQLQPGQCFDEYFTVDASKGRVDRSSCKDEKDLLRKYKMHSYTPLHSRHPEEATHPYNDEDIQQNTENSFVLPKIPVKSNPTKKFKVEVQIQQEYDKKYRISQKKNLIGTNIQPTLRSNALRMKNLIKPFK